MSAAEFAGVAFGVGMTAACQGALGNVVPLGCVAALIDLGFKKTHGGIQGT